MIMDESMINIITYNCNGLGKNPKRTRVFRWIKKNFGGIIYLQETHTTSRLEGEWKNNIGKQYQSYFSHGESNQRGVCTLLPKSLVKNVINVETDSNGRYVIIQLEMQKNMYTLVNIYAPTQDMVKEQLEFYDSLDQVLMKYVDSKLLIGGDFNIVTDPVLDKWNPKALEKPSKGSARLKSIKTCYNLVDIWRILNPLEKKFTWRRIKPFQQSRLDLWLIPDNLIYNVKTCCIGLSFLSDHSVVQLALTINETPRRGKGMWKFNNTLLKETEYENMIVNLLDRIQNDINDITDERLSWEYVKMCIRRETIRYSVARKKRLDADRNNIMLQLADLETKLAKVQSVDDKLLYEYESVKKDYEMLEKEKIDGAILRSKARWAEDGEKSSKFFLNLEKHNNELRHITCLINEKGTSISEPSNVLDELHDFYSRLYTAPRTSLPEDFSEFKPDSLLTNLDKKILDRLITPEECKEALEELPKGKTPGSDGLTSEFMLYFWDLLGNHFYKSLMYSLQYGELSIEQRRAIITLLPKGDKDIRYIKNWRPISILNCDYKIFAKVVANRLKPVLPYLINEDQTGYVRDRVIGENVRIVNDLMYCAKIGLIDGVMMLIDFEKAFDSLSWTFLQYVLHSYGFGDAFKNFVKILYTNISSSVINNGNSTKSFLLQRGIRQGCPASAFLFILCAELLSCQIRNNQYIKGIPIGNKEYNILQFADDTVIFCKDLEGIEESLRVLKRFGYCSGLHMNKSKTELVSLSMNVNLAESSFGLAWCKDSFKYLGIWFSYDIEIMEYKNYRHRIDKMLNLLRIWRQRDLSLRGKVTILKNLAMSQLIYPMSLLECPYWAMEEANNSFFKFLWSGKPDKLRRNVVIRSIEEGGIKMIDIDSMAKSLKTRWAAKLFKDNEKKWCNIPNMFFRQLATTDFIKTHFDVSHIPYNLPMFYRQCLFALHDLQTLDEEDCYSIMNQQIWFSKYVLRNKKPIFNREWYNGGLKYVCQLVNSGGNWIPPDKLFRKYSIVNTPNNVLYLYGLHAAIPRQWISVIQKGKFDMSNDLQTDPLITCLGIERSLCYTMNKDLYAAFIQLKTSDLIPMLLKWSQEYDIDDSSMALHLYAAYSSSRECKVQSLQFKIIHNIYPCGLKLLHWKIFPTSNCLDCKNVDNLLHHFCRCANMRIFWHSFILWWSSICPHCNAITERDIMLGIVNKRCHSFQLNFTILCAKWYIYKVKHMQHSCFFLEFLAEFKYKLKCERINYLQKLKMTKFLRLWQDILDML